MGTLSIEKQRANAQGDQQINGFSGPTRSLENPSLKEGDTWTMPTEYEVMETSIGTNKAEYIFIELEGSGEAKKFFPSTFTKSREVYNEPAQPGALPRGTGRRVHTLGTAAEEYRKHATVAKAMDALKGRKMKVTKVESVRSLRYGTTQLQDTQILTIDFVD